jgi:hypothetical protein
MPGDDRSVEHVGLPGESDRVDALPNQGWNRYPRGLVVLRLGKGKPALGVIYRRRGRNVGGWVVRAGRSNRIRKYSLTLRGNVGYIYYRFR